VSTAVTQYTVDLVPSTGASLTGVPTQTVDMPAPSAAKSFSIRRPIDSASPKLFTMCATGKHFAQVIISMRKSGGSGSSSGKTYLRYTMTTCTVTGYSRSAGTETISFGFVSMTSSGVAPAAGALV
jgi:type VI protein secretion system component Hcp